MMLNSTNVAFLMRRERRAREDAEASNEISDRRTFRKLAAQLAARIAFLKAQG
jgi:hypothetical protein